MPEAIETSLAPELRPRLQWRPAHALRECLAAGYHARDLRADILAGIVVGTVALPLSMALAIASGVPPQHGLYTAIIAGAIIALFGGSHVQVSGPTAAFVVILAPISHQFGLSGLLLASLLAGGLLVAMGLTGMGKLIQFIPYPVVTGFTAGIAVVIATLQIKDFFGLTIEHTPETYVERVKSLVLAFGTIQWSDAVVGAMTLLMLMGLPRLTRRVPAPIIALPVAAIIAYLLTKAVGGFEVSTIDSRFGGIPQTLPHPAWPWSAGGGENATLSLRDLIGPAFAIAMLGAIESLLSAVVADGMSGKRHDSDAELVAQGIGNLVAPFFGGFAATGAIARTATNIRAGGRSPLAAVCHALFILAAMLAIAPLLGYLPMASLAALLLVVAYNMSEVKHAVRVVRIGPRSDAMVLASCFALTVLFDMVISVSVGVVMAALLFMRRMAEMASTRLLSESHPALPEPLPKGVLLYEISGPLFFGAAQKAVSAMRAIASDVSVVILDLRAVPTMDATGLINLDSALETLHKAGKVVVVAGVQAEPLKLMARAGWHHRPWLVVLRSFEESIWLARSLAPSDYDGVSDVHSALAAHHAT